MSKYKLIFWPIYNISLCDLLPSLADERGYNSFSIRGCCSVLAQCKLNFMSAFPQGSQPLIYVAHYLFFFLARFRTTNIFRLSGSKRPPDGRGRMKFKLSPLRSSGKIRQMELDKKYKYVAHQLAVYPLQASCTMKVSLFMFKSQSIHGNESSNVSLNLMILL